MQRQKDKIQELLLDNSKTEDNSDISIICTLGSLNVVVGSIGGDGYLIVEIYTSAFFTKNLYCAWLDFELICAWWRWWRLRRIFIM